VFEAPTVAELAPRIGQGGGLEPLMPVERPAVVPLKSLPIPVGRVRKFWGEFF